MAKEKDTITFIVVPQDGARTYSFLVRRRWLYLMGVVCFLATALFIYMVIAHQGLLMKAIRSGRLEEENNILRAQVSKIAELEGELIRLRSIREHLYEMAGISTEPQQDQSELTSANGNRSLLDRAVPSAEKGGASSAQPAGAVNDSTETSHTPSLWPVRGWVTAEFDEDLHGWEKEHHGLDIAANQGTPILSAATGVVTFSGWDKNLGLVVVLDHQNGLSTLYGHCLEIFVHVGDPISQGQVIAHLGNTGRSSAPHLHFEIKENGVAVNPRKYLGP